MNTTNNSLRTPFILRHTQIWWSVACFSGLKTFTHPIALMSAGYECRMSWILKLCILLFYYSTHDNQISREFDNFMPWLYSFIFLYLLQCVGFWNYLPSFHRAEKVLPGNIYSVLQSYPFVNIYWIVHKLSLYI